MISKIIANVINNLLGRGLAFLTEYLKKRKVRKLENQVFTKGWPDLLAVGHNRIIAIELKEGSDSVKPHQKAMHVILNEAGLETVTFRGDFTSCGGNRVWQRDNSPWLNKILQDHMQPEEFDGVGIA